MVVVLMVVFVVFVFFRGSWPLWRWWRWWSIGSRSRWWWRRWSGGGGCDGHSVIADGDINPVPGHYRGG